MLKQIILLCLLLCTTAYAKKPNGSIGAIYNQDSHPLYGAFLEINNTQFGGYLSVEGNSIDNGIASNTSYTMFSMGPTYFRKWYGASLLLGVYNILEQRLIPPNYIIPSQGYYNKPPGMDDPGIGLNYEFISKNYFLYGWNFIIYPIDDVTLNINMSRVPKLHETYIGMGIGLHFKERKKK